VHRPVAIPGLQSFLHSSLHVVHEHGLGPPPQDNTELNMFKKTRMPSISDNAIFFSSACEAFSCPERPNDRVFGEILYCQFNFVTINEGCGMDILISLHSC